MPSRRLHPKSRNGCVLCKKRRVKCDSTLPSCKNCIRYGSVCSFSESQPIFVSSHTSGSSQPTAGPSLNLWSLHKGQRSPSSSYMGVSPASTASSNGQNEKALMESFSTSLVPGPTPPQNGLRYLDSWLDCPLSSLTEHYFHVQDEELMKNYISTTYLSISNKQSVRDIYRFDIPKEAASHRHLMHAVLAFSAAHLMHTKVNQREMYETRARRHQHLALTSAVVELVDINSSNCHALFGTAGIIAFLAFALQSPIANLSQSPISEIAEFFTLVRGINTILRSTCFDRIVEGRFGALLDYDWHPPIRLLSGDIKLAFDRLRYLKDTTSRTLIFHETYSTTIQSLEHAFAAYSLITQDRILVFSWAIHVTDLYLSLVKERDPLALVILAYYALLLHSIDGIWWSQGRGAWLIEAIFRELPMTWHSEIQLPKDVVQGDRNMALTV